jgi:hypothetical protein
VKARFSSPPTSDTCFEPLSAYVNWSPSRWTIWVWSEFTYSAEGMLYSLTLYAFRKNDFSHFSSHPSGIFFCSSGTFPFFVHMRNPHVSSGVYSILLVHPLRPLSGHGVAPYSKQVGNVDGATVERSGPSGTKR